MSVLMARHLGGLADLAYQNGTFALFCTPPSPFCTRRLLILILHQLGASINLAPLNPGGVQHFQKSFQSAKTLRFVFENVLIHYCYDSIFEISGLKLWKHVAKSLKQIKIRTRIPQKVHSKTFKGC